MSGNNKEGKGGGRGFAGMDEDKQREIASKGGKAAHEKGTAHEFDSEEAREAGRKGGEVVSQDREHMAEIGAKGGHASHTNRGGSGSGNGGGAGSGGGSSKSSGPQEGGGRGFAGMDEEKQREIASKGGKASHGGRGGQDQDR